MVCHQAVEDAVGAGAAIEQVAHDVQPVDGQLLDDLAEADDIGIGAVVADDALDDLAVILVFVVILEVCVEQLVKDIAAVLGQAAAHVVAGVLAGHEPAQIDKPQQCQPIPRVQIFLAGFQLWQLLVRVVNESRQLGTLLDGDALAQHGIDLLADDARRAV